ncbi:MAG: empA, partial [Deltaproteobacteria bacterium]|nr:empA [Deltaproteobacteria bacterium]
MRRLSAKKSVLVLVASLFGCHQADVGGPGEAKDDPSNLHDIADALAALPEATVLSSTDDGVPTYIVGELAKVGAMQTDDAHAAEAALRPSLPPVLAPFRLRADDLALRRMNVDEDGGRHFRYDQRFHGLPVIGSELVVHVDVKGAIFAVNGSARGDISPALGANAISQAQAMSIIAHDARFAQLATTSSRLLYIETADGAMHQAYEAVVEGSRGADPARDKVYVDVDSSEIVAVYPQIHFAESRKDYSANNGTTIPGTLKR